MGSLDQIRENTRDDVEGALAGLKARRADLRQKLKECEAEIALAEQWLGRDNVLAPAKPLVLQEAMALVLRESGNEGMRPQRIADIIHERRLYRKRDGGSVGANQIQARVTNYADMFERVDGLIHLKVDQTPTSSGNAE